MKKDKVEQDKLKDSDLNDNEGVSQSDKVAELEGALLATDEARLRAIADFQNLQRRTEQEKARLTFVSNANLLSHILDLIDDFDRALEHMGEQDESIISGFTAIKAKMQKILDSMNVLEIETKVGDEYNSQIHEAIGTLPVEDDQVDLINQIVQKGYKIVGEEEDYILRPVRVIVGK